MNFTVFHLFIYSRNPVFIHLFSFTLAGTYAMHAFLGNPDRQLVCAEFIQALEECHSRGYLARLVGVCNDQKAALGACLRKERLERTERNRDAAKERTAKKKAVWEALEREKAEEAAKV
ncbi:hypothetical protein C360_04311 [Cryptococcus neoformans Bt15]|nr:hypothetical protein C360_04311 [Cryptococcus neoformans var. grubii Bt15]